MDRKGFIGGSDTTRIMQGDWLNLWMEKTGRRDPDDLSEVLPVQLGAYTEPFNIGWFENMMSATVTSRNVRANTEINGVPVSIEIDGMVNPGEIIEAKHTNPRKSFDEIARYYMPQIQTYIHAVKAEGCWLSVIFGNERWETSFISRNDEYFYSMWRVVTEFWSFVEHDQQPQEPDPEDIAVSQNMIAIDDMVERDASLDNMFRDQAHSYIQFEEPAKAFEYAKKTLKSMVADNERRVYCDAGDFRLEIKRDKRGALRFSTTLLS